MLTSARNMTITQRHLRTIMDDFKVSEWNILEMGEGGAFEKLILKNFINEKTDQSPLAALK